MRNFGDYKWGHCIAYHTGKGRKNARRLSGNIGDDRFFQTYKVQRKTRVGADKDSCEGGKAPEGTRDTEDGARHERAAGGQAEEAASSALAKREKRSHKAKQYFFADNSELKATSQGISYRKTINSPGLWPNGVSDLQ